MLRRAGERERRAHRFSAGWCELRCSSLILREIGRVLHVLAAVDVDLGAVHIGRLVSVHST